MHRLGLVDPRLRTLRTRDAVSSIVSPPKYKCLPVLEPRFEVAPDRFTPAQVDHRRRRGISREILRRGVVLINAAVVRVQSADQPSTLFSRLKRPIGQSLSVGLDFGNRKEPLARGVEYYGRDIVIEQRP